MLIGTILTSIEQGKARVVRCEAAEGGGTCLVPAANAAVLEDEARRAATEDWHADVRIDGQYACPVELVARAVFAPLPIPPDTITIRQARDRLYPTLGADSAWRAIYQDIGASRMQAYLADASLCPDILVSRAALDSIVAAREARTPQSLLDHGNPR